MWDSIFTPLHCSECLKLQNLSYLKWKLTKIWREKAVLLQLGNTLKVWHIKSLDDRYVSLLRLSPWKGKNEWWLLTSNSFSKLLGINWYLRCFKQYTYRIVASTITCYYSENQLFVQRSHYIRTENPLHKQSEKAKTCQ